MGFCLKAVGRKGGRSWSRGGAARTARELRLEQGGSGTRTRRTGVLVPQPLSGWDRLSSHRRANGGLSPSPQLRATPRPRGRRPHRCARTPCPSAQAPAPEAAPDPAPRSRPGAAPRSSQVPPPGPVPRSPPRSRPQAPPRGPAPRCPQIPPQVSPQVPPPDPLQVPRAQHWGGRGGVPRSLQGRVQPAASL